jgi:hypothetical protein
MNLMHKSSNLYLNQPITVRCQNYSTTLDVDIFIGSYGELNYEVSLLCREDYQPEDKTLHIFCISDSNCVVNQLDDRFKLHKVINRGELNRSKYFIFIHEELSIQEYRDSKLNAML